MTTSIGTVHWRSVLVAVVLAVGIVLAIQLLISLFSKQRQP